MSAVNRCIYAFTMFTRFYAMLRDDYQARA